MLILGEKSEQKPPSLNVKTQSSGLEMPPILILDISTKNFHPTEKLNIDPSII